MKAKKSKRANLENYRTIFLQIGFILALSAILVSFGWKSEVKLEKLSNNRTIGIDVMDFPPITLPEAEIPEKVEPPSFNIDIVEDQIDIVEEDLSHLISEVEEGEPIKIYDFENKKEDVDDEPFINAEFMPKFQGQDIQYFRNYIANNVRFPLSAIENGISGTVFTSFIIDKDGSISDIEIVRGVHPVIDNAVKRVIQESPKWEPGMNNGIFVRVKFTIAIRFDLI